MVLRAKQLLSRVLLVGLVVGSAGLLPRKEKQLEVIFVIGLASGWNSGGRRI